MLAFIRYFRNAAESDRPPEDLYDEENDINVWDEGPDTPANLVMGDSTDKFGKNSIRTASLNKVRGGRVLRRGVFVGVLA